MKMTAFFFAVVSLFLSHAVDVRADDWFRATIEDIQRDPERYYGYHLRITGSAVEPSARGYYLENELGNRIEIVAAELPVFDVKYDVFIHVEERDNYYMPDLVEIRRKVHTGGFSWLILGAAIGLMGVLSVGF